MNIIIEALWNLLVLSVIALFIIVLWRNVKADLAQKKENKENEEKDQSDSIFRFGDDEEEKQTEILFTDFNRYLSLIAIFTALAICLIILNSYAPILLYLLQLMSDKSLPLGAIIVSFFVAGFYYTKAIVYQYRKAKMGNVETQVRSRAIVSAFLAFATFSLILNFLPKLQDDYVILKTVNLSFFAGMGTFIVYQKMPLFPLFLSLFSKRIDSDLEK